MARDLMITTLLFLSAANQCSAQDRRLDASVKFPPVADETVARYTAERTHGTISIDGMLDEADWQQAARSPRFVDLISGRRTIHDTRAAVLWDDEFLYVGYWVEEPFVTAKFTERDKPIYQDNDVEFFLAGPDAYYEFEVNAHGTIYEGLFVWQEAYERSGFAAILELDRSRPEVKSRPFDGVGYRNHPRGKRWAFLKWDFPGARTAVHVDGTLNDNSDRDRGWTVELAFPWSGMKPLTLGADRALPPRDGDVWRMDFSRFNQYHEATPAEDSRGWAWSAHGVWDSHVPEVFPYVTFSSAVVGQTVQTENQ
ncbi:MAG: carbohydrate-binding family 9-like protein [Planctomycetaceae bacterium]